MNISASTATGDSVVNMQDENLEDIKEVMTDVESGKVSYAVLDFGGFLGIGNKLSAVPCVRLRSTPRAISSCSMSTRTA